MFVPLQFSFLVKFSTKQKKINIDDTNLVGCWKRKRNGTTTIKKNRDKNEENRVLWVAGRLSTTHSTRLTL